MYLAMFSCSGCQKISYANKSNRPFHATALDSPGRKFRATLLNIFGVTIAAAVFAFSSSANGQSYSGLALYPLTTPTDFSFAGPQMGGTGPAGIDGQTLGSGYGSATAFSNHALLWAGSGNPIDLTPTNLSGFTTSIAYGTDGTQQVGYGSGPATGGPIQHALLWTGTAGTAVDLNPTNLTQITGGSIAYSISGTQQVGAGETSNYSHALLWTETAASAVDLNPTGLTGILGSEAFATTGSQQVGYGYGTAGPPLTHALLWTGTAASAVDLNPTSLPGIGSSMAFGAGGNQQVGQGSANGTGNQGHAILWTGTAASAVDLNPTLLSSFTNSIAEDTNGSVQVGWGDSGGNPHALFWTGTAASAVDLQTLLPSTGTWTSSEAFTIDASGNIYGFATGTFDDTTGNFAVEWSPVPEPASLSLLMVFGTGALMRRRRSPRPIS
jgi:hypothetical protein